MTVIDLSELRSSLGEQASRIIPAVLKSYLAEGEKHVEVLKAADQEFDVEQITRIVHNLKSSSAALGIRQFSALCKEAEQQLRAGEIERSKSLLPRIIEDFAQVKEAAEKILDELAEGKS